MSYHECPRCSAAIAPGNITTDDDWKRVRRASGLVEFYREYMIECHVCDRVYLVTVASDSDERTRVIGVEQEHLGGIAVA